MSTVVQHPRFAELRARQALRAKIERAVSRLIALLDDLDGDPDAEPWLGAPDVNERLPQWPRAASVESPTWRLFSRPLPIAPWRVSGDDREQDVGDEGEPEDEHGAADDAGEPWLGAPENPHDQCRWAQGSRQDLEENDT